MMHQQESFSGKKANLPGKKLPPGAFAIAWPDIVAFVSAGITLRYRRQESNLKTIPV
ncbi:hypothetical protein SAMN05428988_6183 [Chitinophaga sp. YR573]|nr:hypothetical protein SAMN05428988_6183 [Chitinophaga sp. YR573]